MACGRRGRCLKTVRRDYGHEAAYEISYSHVTHATQKLVCPEWIALHRQIDEDMLFCSQMSEIAFHW